MDFLLDNCGLLRLKCLLLIYFYVCDEAADCPDPLLLENTVLSDEALLLNVFHEGTSVALECANGYEIKDGSRIITCLGGTWTESDLTCKKKDCGFPKSQPHMTFDISNGTLFTAVLKVICDEGYQIRGSSFKQCYSTGWVGRSKCEIVTCEKPPEVTNGKSSWDSEDDPKYGDTIEYVCNEGYTLAGKDRLKCINTGQFDAQPPECRVATTEDTIATTINPTSTPTQVATTEDTIATTINPTSTPTQDASSSTDSTSPRDDTGATAAVPHVARGGRVTPAGEEEQVTTSATTATPSLFQEKQGETVDTNRDKGHVAVLVGVLTSVLIVLLVVGAFLYKCHLRKKGSYDTREDLKPELLPFQNS